MSHRRTIAPITTLDVHPNITEIRGILSRLPCVTDEELPLLAEGWHNTTLLAEARRRSLEPDSPLVLEVLACFDTVQSLFAEDLHGDANYLTVEPAVTSTALKAMRDAIAAAYARPILSAAEHGALTKAWRGVYPTDHIVDPDLGGRAADVTALLVAMPRLAARCHDASAAAEFASVLIAGAQLDEDVRCAAREEAWHAAILTSQRRIWQLVCRSGADSLRGYCSTCRERRRDSETRRVLTLCIDAACGLLLADALEHDIVDVLTAPVMCLLPAPHPPIDLR